MICNHYVIITTSGSNLESHTIIRVEFTDGLISDVEFFCFEGGWNILPFILFFLCGFGWGLFFASRFVLLFIGGSHSLRGLNHMPFDSIQCMWKIF